MSFAHKRCVPRLCGGAVLACLAAAPISAAHGQTASFTAFAGLANPPEGPTRKIGRISGNGLRAVGQSFLGEWHGVAWTSPTDLIDVAPGFAWGISEDGQGIVGRNNQGQAVFRTAIAGAWQNVRGFSGQSVITGDALDINANRNIYAGHITDTDGHETAFRYILGAATSLRLGRLDPDMPSYATALNSTGSIVAGYANSPSGVSAWRWTMETGMVALNPGSAGGDLHTAQDMSEDGNTIVGNGNAGGSDQPFRWNIGQGTTYLGRLPGSGSGDGAAYGVSANGSIVVGRDPGPSGSEGVAFYWSAQTGLMSLANMLQQKYGFTVPSGWTLVAATDVSADGWHIGGWGRDPNGRLGAWVINLPSPGPASLMAFAGAFASRRRRPVR